MPQKLRQIDIHIDKANNPFENEKIDIKYKNLEVKDLKNIVRKNSTIVFVEIKDLSFIKEIYDYLEGECNIICYDNDLNTIIQGRTFLNKSNILFFNSDFRNSNLDSFTVDIIIGTNLLGEAKKDYKLLNELSRVLKANGKFLFIELVSLNKPFYGFKNYFKKKKEHIFNRIIFNFQSKLNILKKSQYQIKILGNGNFYFNSSDVNSLQEFCDLIGYRSEDRINILSEILLVLIEGKKEY